MDLATFDFASTVHPDDAQPLFQATMAAAQARVPLEVESRSQRYDGEWRVLKTLARPRIDREGHYLGMIGVNIDVTEAKTAEAALRESETRFRLMADTAPSPVWLTNAAGEIEFVNKALETFYGQPETAILGHVWKTALHPEDAERVLAIQAEHRATYRPYGFEARFAGAGGTWSWMRVSVNPRFDANGDFKGYVGMSFDVTDSREAIEALARQERRQTFLLGLSDRLRELSTPDAAMNEVSAAVRDFLDADRVAYAEVLPETGNLVVHHAATRPGVPDLVGTWPVKDFGEELVRELRAGRVLRVDDLPADPRTESVRAAYEVIQVQAIMTAPILVGGQVRAILFSHMNTPRTWTDAEAAFVEEVASRTWTEIERTRAEAEVRESEERFRAIADTAPVLIWVTNQDRARAFVNQAYVAFYGGTYEDARDADWRAVLHPDDHERILSESLAGEATGEPFALEARYLKHDGAYRWLKSFSRPRLGPGGEIVGFVGVAFDVTDIRETNARLVAAAAERDAILGQLGEGVIVTDPDGAIVFVNEAAVRIHGVDRLDVTPDDYSQAYRLFTEDGRPYPPLELPLARAVIKGETVTEARWRILRPDGVNVLAVGNARPVEGPDGQRIGAVLTLRDETARIQAEHRLTESEARFRTVADSAPALIWMTDVAGDVTFTNRRYKTFFGITREREAEDAWKRLLQAEDAAAFALAYNGAISRRERFESIARVDHPTLGLRWLRCEGLPRFDAAGAFQGYVGANIDVTEAKKAEEDLKRINELLEDRVGEALAEKAKAEADLMHAQRMEAVGRLTGGVAHDFNNLLTVVIGALDIIQRSPKDEAKRQRLTEAALSAARRGERLTHQLLAFSRRQTLRPEPVDLNTLIRESEPLLRRALGEAIEFKLALRRGGARVNVDPAQFEAALLNLIVNARDAMGDQGRITVKTMSCDVKLGDVADLAPGRYICVDVADTGGGIPPEVLSRVFEPFFTTKPVGKGTGLGLSQVYGFTRQSGGGARITSKPGRGAEIRLYLPPLAADKTIAMAPTSGPSRKLKGGQLLLVEDDPGVSAVAVDLLTDLGLTVTAVDSGPAALTMLAERRFDIMLTDIVMPGGMTGIDLARRAAADWPSMRIVLASGYAGDDMDETLKDVPWPFLKKPYSADELAAVLGDPAN